MWNGTFEFSTFGLAAQFESEPCDVGSQFALKTKVFENENVENRQSAFGICFLRARTESVPAKRRGERRQRTRAKTQILRTIIDRIDVI